MTAQNSSQVPSEPGTEQDNDQPWSWALRFLSMALFISTTSWVSHWHVPPGVPADVKATIWDKLGWWFDGKYSDSPPANSIRHSDSPPANSIRHSDVQKLVGLSDQQIREQLGKPNSVSLLPSGDRRIPEECPSECDERWTYYDAVMHKASGTEMQLNAFMKQGKCVFVRVSGRWSLD